MWKYWPREGCEVDGRNLGLVLACEIRRERDFPAEFRPSWAATSSSVSSIAATHELKLKLKLEL